MTSGRCRRSALLAICVSVLAACGGSPARSSAWVATIPPVSMILRELVPDTGEVRTLLAPGGSPHTYEPRPSDAVTSTHARAVISVAPTLDAWAGDLPGPRRLVLLSLVPDSLRRREPGTRPPAADLNDVDPHFWTDPLTVRAMLPALADSLAAMDPANAAAYRARAAEFAAKLSALDAELRRTLAPVRGRRVVLLHPSMRYLLERYGIEVAAVVEPFAGREPTAKDLADLAREVRRTGADAVFSEPQLPERLADAVSELTGVPVAQLDPLGGVPGRQTYEELIRFDASVLRRSLGR